MVDAWNFVYVLPSPYPLQNINDTDIIIPHVLQMGWTESPPYFCTATETGQDVLQYYYSNCNDIPPHPDETHLTKKLTTQTQDNTAPR